MMIVIQKMMLMDIGLQSKSKTLVEGSRLCPLGLLMQAVGPNMELL